MNLKKYFMYEDTDNVLNKKEKHVYKRLYKGIKKPWVLVIIGAIFASFNSLVIFGAAKAYYQIVDGTLESLAPVGKYLIFALLQYVFVMLCIIPDRALVGLNTRVRKKMWKKMMNVSTRDFEKMGPNSMLSRITSDADYASKPFAAVIGFFSIVVAILSVGSSIPEGASFASVGLIIVFVFAILVVIITSKVLSKSTTAVQTKISKQTNLYSEQLANIRFIKASNGEEKSLDNALKLIDERYNAQLYQALYKGLYELCNRYSLVFLYVASLLGGIIAISSGLVTSIDPIKSVYTFFIAMEATIAASMIFPLYFSATHGASLKLVEVFSYNDEVKNQGEQINDLNGDIKFNDVSFAYNQNNVINKASVVIESKKITAIVGANGSGKSTFVKLINRLYATSEGNVCIGDVKDSETSIESWRDMFAVVSQNSALFSGTIKENICYGVKEVSDEKVLKVVHAAKLDEVVNERGLDYEIGLRGSKLSGGQAQRVAIARAMMKNAPCIILDEATANLDSKTEKEVKSGLKELMKDRTTIIIAHDYSAIEDADNIIVLNDGKVEACGTKNEVIKNNDFAKAMAHIQ